jgi:glycine/D-amino acid oxidase-like deaminating enzyme
LPAPLSELEPSLADANRPAFYLRERSVDPRALVAAAVKAARQREVDVASGTEVSAVLIANDHVAGVATEKTSYAAPVVVNCAGAWAGQVAPLTIPTRPVKGQMLSVVGVARAPRHVIRTPEVYLVPRNDGRVLIGTTVEEAGFDKRTDASTIRGMHNAAVELVPGLREGRILEDWAGLRPGSPDNLPILGATKIDGYLVATGHFRDGILLAPITAHIMSQVITGKPPDYDMAAFSPTRFQL